MTSTGTRAASGRPFDHVLIVGAGLMGTSLGLALRRHGVEVGFEDAEDSHLRFAVSVGAGGAGPTTAEPDLVVVAVPPAAVADVVTDALRRYPRAIVTDLGSVKDAPCVAVVQQTGPLASRYVGGHPMAGSEQSGPLAGQADLFDGRAWAITPHPGSAPDAVAAIERLARLCGAVPVWLTPAEHDEAVALVSHLPHVASVVVAGLLTTAVDPHLRLAGQGLRDVTRIAGSDAGLWTQILSANAVPVARLLREASERLEGVAVTLESVGADDAKPETLDDLRGVLERGARGVRRLPGKHGTRPEEFVSVPVLVPDRPGELARLFAEVDAAGVNVEDVRIDHSPGAPAGLVQLAVDAGAAHDLVATLGAGGWGVHREQVADDEQRRQGETVDVARLVVAVDGPAGSGKSSAARGVARRLGLRYLDTGAMYRALTWWMLRAEVDLSDPDAIARRVDQAALEIGTDPVTPTIAVDGIDVAAAIRTRDVSNAVSAVSAVPDVRARMVALQRAVIGRGGIVVEGRDIGTTVAPDAAVKVFLTADAQERARRRAAELSGEARAMVDLTQQELARRDHTDSTRRASPLSQAADATVLDTTSLDLAQVVAAICALADAALSTAASRPHAPADSPGEQA